LDLEGALSLARSGYRPHDVLRLAAAHGVRPQLTAALKDVAVEEFAFLKRTLEDYKRLRAPLYLRKAGEIARIGGAFAERDIPFMLLKGMALSVQLYGDSSQRESDDVDLIVPATYLDKAEATLLSCGYKHELGTSGEWRRAFLGYHGQYTFVASEPQLPPVDLHWELAPSNVPFPPLDVWANPEHVKLANRSIPTINSSLLPYYLAAHGAKERWRSLAWLCDLAQYYCRSDLDWMVLLRDAGPSLRRQLVLGLTLIERVLGVPVKPELLQAAAGDAKLESQIQATLRRLSNPFAGKPDQLDTLRFYGGWREKARAMWLLLARRTVGDYRAVPLPRWLWRAYHLIRPFRLALKILSIVPHHRRAR
jgi:hypothetical protein